MLLFTQALADEILYTSSVWQLKLMMEVSLFCFAEFFFLYLFLTLFYTLKNKQTNKQKAYFLIFVHM